MSTLVDKGLKWGKSALALKLGKTVIKRGGLFGVGAGAVAGAGYLAYNFYKKNKAAAGEKARPAKLKKIDNIDDNYPGIEGDKKIVI